ncbi:MAG: S9 family peptidase [Pyrinomonadaceae bacterium]|nr:S9 family peptidase [Pyrinomonadaceae bacterium]
MKKFFFLLVWSAFGISAFAQEKYTIQQYLNIRSASAPMFADKSGKQIFYLTNVSGTSQIWMIDAAGASVPKQITSYDDNIGFVSSSPNGDGVVFGKAVGGNENTQFFWMKPDGTAIRQLTNNPAVRHNFGDWSDDGKRIYYASNKRDKNFFDIYAMEATNGKEELIYQQDGNNDFAAVSKDGRQIIISRSGTEFGLDNNLYLIDAATKKVTLLTPHTDASQFGDVEFLPDGDSIVLATNKDREYSSLAQMDNLRSDGGANVIVVGKDAPDWDVEAIRVSPKGNALAYTVNRDGFSELNLRKIESGGKPLISNFDFKSEIIKLPAQGIVGGLQFSDDGGKLAFSFSSAKYNSDVWLYDLPSKSLTQITKSSRSDISQTSFVEPQLIKYKTFDGREIPAWYYRPEKIVGKIVNSPAGNFSVGIRPTKNLPVIVSVHGGPEGQERPGFNPLYQYYLSRGYAVLATNVRGSTGYGKTFTHLDDVQKREDSVKDLAFAVEWLKTSGGADPKRIAVTGGSYGGYMTMAAITLYPDLFAAAVNTVGIVNWETFLKNTSGYRRRQREVEYGMLDKDIEFLRRISPIAKVDKIKTPLFVIHGKNDPRVPYTEAEQIVKVLKDKGAIVEYKLYDDEGHGISKLKNRLDLYPRVADFLDKYMK